MHAGCAGSKRGQWQPRPCWQLTWHLPDALQSSVDRGPGCTAVPGEHTAWATMHAVCLLWGCQVICNVSKASWAIASYPTHASLRRCALIAHFHIYLAADCS